MKYHPPDYWLTETMDRRLKFKFRLDRIRWLADRTAFITPTADDNGRVTQYLVHWNWPLSGQKCRIDAATGEIIEYSEQDHHGIKIHQTTGKHSLEAEFGDSLSYRLKYLKDHVDGLHKENTTSEDNRAF